MKKVVFKFLKIHRKTTVSATLLKKRLALALVFSCEFCEIFKNTFFTEHFRAAASEPLIF